MNIVSLRSVYFLGIGGIGMSALARYFNRMGTRVSGYDKTPTSLTTKLIQEGIKIHFDEDTGSIPADTELVIYTPAIPKDNKELNYCITRGYTILKRSEVLGLITKNDKTIAVAGTHGKTTISAMIAHIFKQSGKDFTAFLGGISKNYNGNYITGNADPNAPLLPLGGFSTFIAEADEFDRSFLHLTPSIAVITSTDADHLDIYKNHQDLKNSFSEFIKKIKPGGILITKPGLDIHFNDQHSPEIYTYSLHPGTHYYPSSTEIQSNSTVFDLVTPSGTIDKIVLGVPGVFNLENSIAALAVACLSDIPKKKMKEALRTFQGVQRRFDFHIIQPDFIYIDDYAHHPEELRSCISAVKELYPHKKITGVFQPHLYSRTRDLADDFATSLELLDELILLEIYPAREKAIPGVTAKMLFDKIRIKSKVLCSKEKVLDKLKNRKPEILLTLGAGDIDQLVEPIIQYYKQSE
jgi:UDP-N-acetylmuramate--alanine ligase